MQFRPVGSGFEIELRLREVRMELNGWMTELRHWLFYPFGASPGNCRTCGAWLQAEKSLCDACLKIFESNFAQVYCQPHPLRKSMRCRHLAIWNPGESDFLSEAILSLKGSGARKTWDECAKIFLRTHARDLLVRGPYPAAVRATPASHPQRLHAQHFAEALAGYLGVPLIAGDPLNLDTKNEGPTQKKRGRRERLKRLQTPIDTGTISMTQSHVPTSSVTSNSGLLVIVDDVLTTGATSLWGAREAKWPGPCEVWSLVYRSRLAP